MKIQAFFLCYNEAPLLPFVLQHYSEFCDKITIYLDDLTTDNSLEIIKQFPKAEVIGFVGNGLDDRLLRTLKNTIWKGAQCDWVIVADMDELLYCRNIKQRLEELQADGITIIKPYGFNMISDTFPQVGQPITEQITKGIPNEWESKCIIFNPNKINEINYTLGAHDCQPTGEVKLYRGADIKLLHYKLLSLDYYKSRRTTALSRIPKDFQDHVSIYDESDEARTKLFNDYLASAEEIVNV